jgi:adenylate cyclase
MLQEELRHESAAKANLLRQFSPAVAEQFLSRGSLQPSGERSEVTILYCDIRGFTSLSRNMEPVEVVAILNDYFNRLTPIIFAHGGTVDKYIGDAILAVFGSPKPDAEQHQNAVRDAVDMQDAMRTLNEMRAAQGKTTCDVGIGVDSGEVLHGFIGVLHRMKHTVIGDVVNCAARYCDAARAGEVLLSPQVYEWVWEIVEATSVSVKTKHEGSLAGFRVKSVKRYDSDEFVRSGTQ